MKTTFSIIFDQWQQKVIEVHVLQKEITRLNKIIEDKKERRKPISNLAKIHLSQYN